MTVTAISIATQYPAFASVDPDTIALYIADAVLEEDPTFWGALYDKAVTLKTLHLMDMSNVRGLSQYSPYGNATSINVTGEYSVSYTGNPTSDDPLDRTFWGQEYKRLLNRVNVTGLVTDTGVNVLGRVGRMGYGYYPGV